MFVHLIGFVAAHLPECVVKALCEFLGFCLYWSPRGRLVRDNMHHAYPTLSAKELKALAHRACINTIELGALGMAGRFFSEARWRRTLIVPPAVAAEVEALQAQPRGVFLLIPHTTMMEGLTVLPLFFKNCKPTSVLYRAFDSAATNANMVTTRTRFGVTMLSRRTGLLTLIKALKRGENAGMLFDQNTGQHGALISFMGRLAAASDFPEIVAQNANPIPVALALRRTGFWRGELQVELLVPPAAGGAPLIIQAHRWLEKFLNTPDQRPDWLWPHRRWRACFSARRRLGFNHKQVMEVPTERRTRLLVRIPNWLGDIIMALPILRAIQESRPDVEITFLGKQSYMPLIESLGIGHKYIGVPAKPLASVRFCFGLRALRFDFSLAFTNSLRGDLELWASGIPQRLGLLRPGKLRPLLTDGYRVSKEALATQHQSHIWEAMAKAFGLTAPVRYTPFAAGRAPAAPGPLVFVPGSANTPEKRWPAQHWRALCQSLSCPITLVGTPAENALCAEIAEGLPHVINLAGKTDMAGLAKVLSEARVVVGGITGALHLANAVGAPTLVIYGPHRPDHGRPIYTTQAEQLLTQEGAPMVSIAPEAVLSTLKQKGFVH